MNTVTMQGVNSPPADPLPYKNMGYYVDITCTGQVCPAYINLSFLYTDAQIMARNETTLEVWKHNGTWYINYCCPGTSPVFFLSYWQGNAGEQERGNKIRSIQQNREEMSKEEHERLKSSSHQINRKKSFRIGCVSPARSIMKTLVSIFLLSNTGKRKNFIRSYTRHSAVEPGKIL